MEKRSSYFIFFVIVMALALIIPMTVLAAAPGDTVSISVPFNSAEPITALQLTYTLSSGLTFVSASCPTMTGSASNTTAVFISMDGVTSGTVTIQVKIAEDALEDQSINITEITGANTSGQSSVGTPAQYPIAVNAPAPTPGPFSVGHPSSPGNVMVGSQISTSVNITGGKGGYAYNWYLFQYVPEGGYAIIPMMNVGVFDSSWTFNLPDIEGTYCIRVIATDGTTVDFSDSDWFYVYPAPFVVGKPTYPGNVPEGTVFTASTEITGGRSQNGCAYNFYLFHSTGTIVQQLIGVFDNRWELTLNIEASDAQQGLGSIYLIRVIATDGMNVGYADTDWFYVYPNSGSTLSAALTILRQPEDQTVGEGASASFTVEAAGSEPLAYQWYVNTSNGIGWVSLIGKTENTYVTDAGTLADNGFRYYCEVTDANGASVASDIAALAVTAVPQTGDRSHPEWMTILLFASAMGIMTLIAHTKAQSERR